jgi:hypothetical protein
VAGFVLAVVHLIPWLVVGFLVVLLVRAGWGLSRHRTPARARQVGFSELALGLAYVLAAAVGYWLGI